MSKVDRFINVIILGVRSYCNDTWHCHREKLGERYTRALYGTSYNWIWIYDYLKVKGEKKIFQDYCFYTIQSKPLFCFCFFLPGKYADFGCTHLQDYQIQLSVILNVFIMYQPVSCQLWKISFIQITDGVIFPVKDKSRNKKSLASYCKANV